MNNKDYTTFQNKVVPAATLHEVKVAVSHFPELYNVPIIFRIKRKLNTSFMKAQPVFNSLLSPKKKRSYIILISESFEMENSKINLEQIPKEVLIGWIGHELGHIMDYKNRSTINLLFFGVRYLFFSKHIRSAERAADTYAVQSGMREYILKTKDFILKHANLSEKYKARIKRLYLSPDEIMEIIVEKQSIENTTI